MAVKHRFISALPDSPNAGLIRPSNWNDTHDLQVQCKASAKGGVRKWLLYC